MWYVHTMECYLSGPCYSMDKPWGNYAKWKKSAPHIHLPTTHTNTIWWAILVKFIEIESRMVDARGFREVGMGSYLIGRVSDLKDENVLEISCTTVIQVYYWPYS